MSPVDVTKQDPRGTGWSICDRVFRLRYWGTTKTIELTGGRELVAGTSADCSIRLVDPSERVSRRHASFSDDGAVWTVQDLGSTNGTKQDGETRKTFQIVPADVIELGPIKLVAESESSIRLHRLLQRFIGWSEALLPDVDAALSSVREMATLRNILILRGDRRPDKRRALTDGQYLAGAVARLHQLTLGAEHPLIFHDRERSGTESLKLASGGLLCVDANAAPKDFAQVVPVLRLPETRVRLVLCAAGDDEIEGLQLRRTTTIEIPGLAKREADFERLLEEYGAEAVFRLGATGLAFRPQDPRWLQQSGPQTLDELEEDAKRLVALRNWGVSEGAKKLGITHGALSQWARVRNIPT